MVSDSILGLASVDPKQPVPKSTTGQLDNFIKIKLMDFPGTKRMHSGPEVVESRISAKLVEPFALAGPLEERYKSRLG
tara:strand:- start:182 stop:415 length:234 start_codon:yes stop_codon:yes gene_type:complete